MLYCKNEVIFACIPLQIIFHQSSKSVAFRIQESKILCNVHINTVHMSVVISQVSILIIYHM